LVYVPGVAAALSIVFVTQATYFIPMSEGTQKAVAIVLLFFIMFINILSTKLGSKVQLVATIGKLIPIFVISKPFGFRLFPYFAVV
jgi:APA family basic amino acid/polyamine antiporter